MVVALELESISRFGEIDREDVVLGEFFVHGGGFGMRRRIVTEEAAVRRWGFGGREEPGRPVSLHPGRVGMKWLVFYYGFIGLGLRVTWMFLYFWISRIKFTVIRSGLYGSHVYFVKQNTGMVNC